MNIPFQDIRLNHLFRNMGTGTQMPTFGGAYQPVDILEPTPVAAPTMPEMGGGYDVDARMKELFNPSTVSIDRFNEMIGQYPQYEEPSMLRKIASAALATLGDMYGPQGSGKMAFSEGMGFGKHNRAIQDWESQIEPLERAANIERQSNTNQRTSAYQTISAELRQQAQDARAAQQERDADIRQQRADVYQWKAMNPNLQFDFSGPKVIVTNPQTGEIITTNIDTGNLTDMDRMQLQHRQSMEQIGARGNVQAGLEDQRQTNRMALENERQEGRVDLENTRSNNRGTDDETPTQTKQRVRNNAERLANEKPEYRQFIEFTPDGDVRIVEPATQGREILGFPVGGSNGPTQQQYDEIYQAIFGTSPTGAGGSGRGNEPPARAGGPGPRASNRPGQQVLQKQQRNPSTGAVRTVYSYDGGRTWTTRGGGG